MASISAADIQAAVLRHLCTGALVPYHKADEELTDAKQIEELPMKLTRAVYAGEELTLEILGKHKETLQTIKGHLVGLLESGAAELDQVTTHTKVPIGQLIKACFARVLEQVGSDDEKVQKVQEEMLLADVARSLACVFVLLQMTYHEQANTGVVLNSLGHETPQVFSTDVKTLPVPLAADVVLAEVIEHGRPLCDESDLDTMAEQVELQAFVETDSLNRPYVLIHSMTQLRRFNKAIRKTAIGSLEGLSLAISNEGGDLAGHLAKLRNSRAYEGEDGRSYMAGRYSVMRVRGYSSVLATMIGKYYEGDAYSFAPQDYRFCEDMAELNQYCLATVGMDDVMSDYEASIGKSAHRVPNSRSNSPVEFKKEQARKASKTKKSIDLDLKPSEFAPRGKVPMDPTPLTMNEYEVQLKAYFTALSRDFDCSSSRARNDPAGQTRRPMLRVAREESFDNVINVFIEMSYQAQNFDATLSQPLWQALQLTIQQRSRFISQNTGFSNKRSLGKATRSAIKNQGDYFRTPRSFREVIYVTVTYLDYELNRIPHKNPSETCFFAARSALNWIKSARTVVDEDGVRKYASTAGA